MKVLITTSAFNVAGAPALRVLEEASIQLELNPFQRRLSEEEAARLYTPDVVGAIAGLEPLTRRVIQNATGLRVISRCGVGLDSIDLEAAAAHGVEVLNTPQAPADAVAELTLAHMLAVLRKIPQSDRAMRHGEWNSLAGGLLRTRTVGVVGYGRIGRRVAELAAAFGAKTIATDPALSQELCNIPLTDFGELLRCADIVTLHAPYSRDAPVLIGQPQLEAMKPGAILINASRGGLVDERALINSLECGHLAGAGIDTFETEPYRGPLTLLDQVVLSAHMGSRAVEARAAMERESVANLVDVLARLDFVARSGNTD